MVRAHFPQRSVLSIISDTNNPPQGFAQGVAPAVDKQFIVIYPPVADVTFQFYKFYQIKTGQAAISQTNMPLVIIDSLPAGSVQEASGFDIRVFDSLGNPIPYESIDINLNVDDSADIEIWLNMPNVVDGDFIQLAFGKPTATDGSTPNTVYDSNYKGVYHLNQTVFGAGSIIDSTINGNDGTDTGTISSVTGKIGKAIRYATSSHIDLGSSIMVTMAGTGTVSMWANVDDLTTAGLFPMLFSLRGSLDTWEAFFQTTDDTLRLRFGDGGSQEIVMDLMSEMVNEGQNHYFTFVWNQPSSIVKIYIDGTLIVSETRVWTTGVIDDETFLGNTETLGGNTSLVGFEDEVRFSNIERDANWVKAEFNNQNDNDAFWFKTPRLVSGETNHLIDDQGRRIVAEGN